MGRRTSNKRSDDTINKIAKVWNCNKVVMKAIQATLDGRYDTIWKMLEKGRNCTGELNKCQCNKLHLNDISEAFVRCDYPHSKVMAGKCLVYLTPHFFGSMPNRKLLWSTVAYCYLVSEFRSQMTDEAYTYYEFSFPNGTYFSAFLPHSKLTPKYLANTVFPAALDDDLLVEPFYATIMAINMDNMEKNEALSYLEEMNKYIESHDHEVIPGLRKFADEERGQKYASYQNVPIPKKMRANFPAGALGTAMVNDMLYIPPDQMMAMGTKQREALEAARKKEYSVKDMIDSVKTLECHNFGHGQYKKEEITLVSEVFSKLKTPKRWLCEVATSLLPHANSNNSYTKLYCYQIRFSSGDVYSSQLKEFTEHEPTNDWQSVFSSRKNNSLPMQFQLCAYFVDTTHFGEDMLQTNAFVDGMKSIVETQKYANGDPFQPSWQQSTNSAASSEAESTSAHCTPSNSDTRNVEKDEDYVFSAEDFKYKTKLAKKAKASPISVSSAYKIICWDVKPQTMKSVIKCFSVEFDEKFLQHTKDQNKVIALVCCDIVMGNGVCLPNECEQAICVRLTSGHNILTALLVITAELNPEHVKEQMFEKCQSDFSVMNRVEIEVEWRIIN